MKRYRIETRDYTQDWRNPFMPVYRDYRMGNGEAKTEIDPDYERRYREHLMASSAHPGWREDPTYNLRKVK